MNGLYVTKRCAQVAGGSIVGDKTSGPIRYTIPLIGRSEANADRTTCAHTAAAATPTHTAATPTRTGSLSNTHCSPADDVGFSYTVKSRAVEGRPQMTITRRPLYTASKTDDSS
ncbi:hypothetical protein LSAT2_020811 [Lamellibrachia satsuma]|nr:hypothetical protein LSAT2_020811 [Lamellibrachia satsuma]